MGSVGADPLRRELRESSEGKSTPLAPVILNEVKNQVVGHKRQGCVCPYTPNLLAYTQY